MCCGWEIACRFYKLNWKLGRVTCDSLAQTLVGLVTNQPTSHVLTLTRYICRSSFQGVGTVRSASLTRNRSFLQGFNKQLSIPLLSMFSHTRSFITPLSSIVDESLVYTTLPFPEPCFSRRYPCHFAGVTSRSWTASPTMKPIVSALNAWSW